MRKFLFLSLIVVATVASAQTQIGLKLAPVIASNRVSNDDQTVESDGAAMKLSIGVVVDKPLSDNYFLSTGLIYLPKRAAVAAKDNSFVESYTLQYLQIPATLKLFTNEVAPDMNVYFQVGLGLELKVFDEKDEPDFVVVDKFNPIDMSVILGTGVEYRAGVNTILFGGISYQRGLANSVNEINQDLAVVDGQYQSIQIRNTIISLDFGVKF